MADVNLTLARDTTSSASCSTSHSPDHPNSYVYQVFINHRGPDVKKGIASHIYYRLKALGVAAFLDQRELQEGENMTPQIEGAIRTASVQIAIFSPRYAESSWCLKELVLMLESRATIIPIFYHVSPGELKRTQARDGVYFRLLSILQCIFLCARDESGGYARALRMLEKKPRHDSDTIKKWKDALFSVAEISGFELNACNGGDEGQLVDEVVEKVLEEVRRPPLDVAKYPTGLAENVKGLDVVIAPAKGEPRIVAIVGLGGIGKTTVAKEFFNSARAKSIRAKDNRFCFLFDVRSKSLDSLQSSLLEDLGIPNVQIKNVDEGKSKIKMHVSSTHHALVVLDDVDHIDQLDALLFPVKDVIHPESLILVTSRNKDVLTSSGIMESSIYTMKGLSPQHSQELFCWHAFGQPHPVVGFVEVVQKFLDTCNGLPLSLKVLGALLSGKDDLEYWNEQLHKTSKILPSDIQRTLMISYDALEEVEKQIFLDIACFFIGEDKDTAITVWDGSDWFGRLGFWKLENRCLVEVDSQNCLRMHDHIRDLGRDMAKDSKYPRRLWKLTEDDLYNVSEQSSVRGISMVHGNASDQSFESLSDSCNLSNLRILRAEGYSVERVFGGELPRLMYLRWENCLSSSLPFSLPIKNLKVLHIEGRNLETLWQHESQAPLQLKKLYIDGPLSVVPESIGELKHLEEFVLWRSDHESLPNEFCNMHSLKHVSFNFCEKMTLLPQSIGNLTKLHILELLKCSSLQALPDSVGNLTGLQTLDLECKTLKRLPASIGNLTGLQRLRLYACSTLQALPDSVGNLTGLQSLDLGKCSSLQALPDSVGNLTDLQSLHQSLHLPWCSTLQGLPDSVGNLTGLQSLDLRWCSTLQALPDSVGNLTGLQSFGLRWCSTLQLLPDSVGNLTGLQSLDLYQCSTLQALPDSVGNLRGLQSLGLHSCSTLQALPESVGNLTGLQSLDLYRCSTLQVLPDSVGNLTGLKSLDLYWCSTLQALPDSVGNLTDLQSLDLRSCSTLQTLPDSVGNLTGLQSLDPYMCSTLQALPDSFGNLTGLRSLDLGWCSTLLGLPDSFGNLTGLRSLDLGWCSTLQALPDSVGNLTSLRSLGLRWCSTLQVLPDSVGNLTGLQSLDLGWCSTLQALPDSVGNLTGLQSLGLRSCSTLQVLPDSVGKLTGLRSLDLYMCSNLQALPDSVGNLTGLQSLDLGQCSTLQALTDSVGKLTGLQSLDLGQCSTLQALADSVGNLTGLQTLDLGLCSTLQALPDSVGNLTGLQNLDLYMCSNLQALPNSVGNLTGLQTLDLQWCSTLQALPDSVGTLTGLQHLLLRECSKLEMLPNVEHLSSLELLHVCGCSKLQWSEGVVEQLRQRLGEGFMEGRGYSEEEDSESREESFEGDTDEEANYEEETSEEIMEGYPEEEASEEIMEGYESNS